MEGVPTGNFRYLESIWAGYPSKVNKLPPVGLLMTILGFFVVLVLILLLPFYNTNAFFELTADISVVSIESCFVRMSNDLTCSDSFKKGSMSVDDVTLQIDGTSTNQCEVDMCIPDRDTPLTIFLSRSTIVMQRVSLPSSSLFIASVRPPTAESTDDEVPGDVFATRVILEDVSAPDIAVDLENGVVTLGTIKRATPSDNSTSSGEGELNVVVAFGAVEVYADTLLAGGSSVNVSATVNSGLYCLPANWTDMTYAIAPAAPNAYGDEREEIQMVIASGNTTASSASSGFSAVNISTSSLYIKNSLDVEGAMTGGEQMLRNGPKLSPELVRSVGTTGNWSEDQTFADFVQTIEVVTPSIGMALLHTRRKILLEIGPEWITFMTGFALIPPHRKYSTALSHYKCAAPLAPKLASDMARSMSNWYEPKTAALAKATLFDQVTNEQIYNLTQDVYKASDRIGMVAFETPETAIVNPRGRFEAFLRKNGKVEIRAISMSTIAIALLVVSWTLSFFCSFVFLAVVRKNRGNVLRVFVLHKYRYLLRSITGYSDKCPYRAYFSMVTLFSWLTFHVSRFAVKFVTELREGGFLREFLQIHFRSAYGVASEDIVVVPKSELSSIYNRWMSLRLLEPSKDVDFNMEVSRLGGRFSFEKVEVVTALRRRKAASQQSFSFSYEGMMVVFERSPNVNDEVLVSEIVRLATKADVSASRETVRKKLAQWDMTIIEREIEVLVGLVQAPNMPFADPKSMYEAGEAIEGYCASTPRFAPISRMAGCSRLNFLINGLFESVVGGTTAFLPIFLTYMITTPLEVEYAKYTVETRVLSYSEKGQLINELVVANPRSPLVEYMLYMAFAYIALMVVEPLSVLPTFSKLMVKNKLWPPHPRHALVYLRWTASVLLIFLVTIAVALTVGFIFNLLIWWILGMVIAPSRMLVYAASAISLIALVGGTYKRMKEMKEFATRHVKEKILLKLSEMVRRTPAGGSADEKEKSVVTGGMLYDVATGDEQALQDFSTAVGCPVASIALGLAAIKRTSSTIDHAMKPLVKELGFPEDFVPLVQQLVYHQIGLPVNPVQLLHGLYQFAPDKATARKLRNYDDVLVPLLTCLLTKDADDDDVAQALLQVLTGQISSLTDIKGDVLHRIFDAGLQMYLHQNIPVAATNIASVLQEFQHKIPPHPPTLPATANASIQGLLFAGSQPNKFLPALKDLFQAVPGLTHNPFFVVFSKLLVEADQGSGAAAADAAREGVSSKTAEEDLNATMGSISQTVIDASIAHLKNAENQMNLLATIVNSNTGNKELDLQTDALSFVQMAMKQLQSRLGLHFEQLKKLRALYAMVVFDASSSHWVSQEIDTNELLSEAYELYDTRPWKNAIPNPFNPKARVASSAVTMVKESGLPFIPHLVQRVEKKEISPLSVWIVLQWCRMERMVLNPPGLTFRGDGRACETLYSLVSEAVMLPPGALRFLQDFGIAFDMIVGMFPDSCLEQLKDHHLRADLLQLGMSTVGLQVSGDFMINLAHNFEAAKQLGPRLHELQSQTVHAKKETVAVTPADLVKASHEQQLAHLVDLVAKCVKFTMHPLNSLPSGQEDERRRTYRELGYFLIEIYLKSSKPKGSVERTSLIDDAMDCLLSNPDDMNFDATTFALQVPKAAVRVIANPSFALTFVPGLDSLNVILPLFTGKVEILDDKQNLLIALRLFGVESFRVTEARNRLKFFASRGVPLPVPMNASANNELKEKMDRVAELRDMYLDGRLSKTRDSRVLALAWSVYRSHNKDQPDLPDIDEDEMMEVVVHYVDIIRVIKVIESIPLPRDKEREEVEDALPGPRKNGGVVGDTIGEAVDAAVDEAAQLLEGYKNDGTIEVMDFDDEDDAPPKKPQRSDEPEDPMITTRNHLISTMEGIVETCTPFLWSSIKKTLDLKAEKDAMEAAARERRRVSKLDGTQRKSFFSGSPEDSSDEAEELDAFSPAHDILSSEILQLAKEKIDSILHLKTIHDFIKKHREPRTVEEVFSSCSPTALLRLFAQGDIDAAASMKSLDSSLAFSVNDPSNKHLSFASFMDKATDSAFNSDCMFLMGILSGYLRWATTANHEETVFIQRFPPPFKALCCAAAQKQKTRPTVIDLVVNTFPVRHRLLVADLIGLSCGTPKPLFGIAGLLNLSVNQLRTIAAIVHPDTRWTRTLDDVDLNFNPTAFAVIKDITQANYYRLLAWADLHHPTIIEAVMVAILKRDPVGGPARVDVLQELFPTAERPTNDTSDVHDKATPLLKVLARLAPRIGNLIRSIEDMTIRRQLNLALGGLFTLRGSYDEAAACFGKWGELNSVNFALSRLVLFSVRMLVEEMKVRNPPDIVRCVVSIIQLINIFVIAPAKEGEIPKRVRLFFEQFNDRKTLRLIEMGLSATEIETHIPIPPLVALKGRERLDLTPKEIRQTLRELVETIVAVLIPEEMETKLPQIQSAISLIVDAFFQALGEPSFESLIHTAIAIVNAVDDFHNTDLAPLGAAAVRRRGSHGSDGTTPNNSFGRPPSELKAAKHHTQVLFEKLSNNLTELVHTNEVSVSMIVFMVLQIVMQHYATVPEAADEADSDSLVSTVTNNHIRSLRLLLQVANENFSGFMELVAAMGLQLDQKNAFFIKKLFNLAAQIQTGRNGAAGKKSVVYTPTARDVMEAIIMQLFNEYDTDNTGSIDVNEFEGILLRMGLKLHRHEAAMLFNEADIDGSGDITIGEFHYIIDSFEKRLFLQLMAVLGLTDDNIFIAVATLAFMLISLCAFLLLGISAFYDGSIIGLLSTAALPLMGTFTSLMGDPGALTVLKENIERGGDIFFASIGVH